jgi:rSAM/selenodomain-associated transferase 1
MTIVVMTKLPVAGRVKTRLTPQLSQQQAAQVHAVFLRHVTARLAPLGELVICFDPADAEPALRDIVQTSAQYVRQCPGDLGARLAHAFSQVNTKPALFFAIDSPDVPIGSVVAMMELLRQNDLVIGPCNDGGYWCLGAKRNVDVDLLLNGIQWSSGKEFSQTIERARALGYRVGIGQTWDDVDRPDDLRRLVLRLRKSDNTGDMQLLDQLSFLPPGVLS